MTHDPMIKKLISASMLRLRSRSPFFATLAMFATVHITDTVETAATDGRDLFFNPDYFQRLRPAQQDGLMAHEVLHAALLHLPRRGARDPLLWNIAADIVVNGIVRRERSMELPSGVITDKELEDKRVEEVYELLQKEVSKRPPLAVQDLMVVEHSPGSTAERRAAISTYWGYALQQARIVTEMRKGTLPAGLLREFDALNPAQIDWRSYLWRFLVQTPTDFSGFDRRFLSRKLYLETLEGETLQVRICVDTSGSVSGEQLSTFLSEVRGIVGSYPHLRCQLYYADAALYGPFELEDSNMFPKPQGGGGTDFRPFFDALEQEADPYKALVAIYLTDGYGSFPDKPPSAPTLWVLTPGGLPLDDIPFGERVRLLVEG